jgi:uncharacterized RDD family membrane protein YckC
LAAAVAHRFSFFLTAFILLLHSAQAADLTPHDLVAHGDADQFWIARIDQPANAKGSPQSTIYSRQLGQEGKWQAITPLPLPARVVSLASLNGQAAALMDDGSWTLLYADTGPFTGGPLPEPARMVVLAGGINSWWAVGAVPGGIAGLPTTRSAATHASTAAAGALSRPATGPAAEQLVLFTLAGNDWQPRAEISDPVVSGPAVSLVMIDDTPYLADAISGGVRVRHLQKDRWVNDVTLSDLPKLAGFKLLSTSQVPRLWVEPLKGPDRIYSLNGHGGPVDLAEIPGSSPDGRTIAVATGKLRVLAIVNGDVVEQDYGLSNIRSDGSPSPVPLPRPSPLVQLQQLQFWLVVIALFFAMLGSYRQRAAMRDSGLKPESIMLAPLGRRFAAGLIDATPAILALAYAVIHFGSAGAVNDPNRPAIFLLIYGCAGIFYILYLTLLEALLGRSPGKLLMNLRIIGIDGKPAQTSVLITRNLLRVIDVGIFFLPLLLIVLMPLRQRAGDVAAGTLVVKADVTPEPEPTEEAATTTTTEATTSAPEQPSS